MRTNLPVTQNEIVIKPDVLIVSRTDLKGRITYVNRDFIEVSGFSEPELIGQPHNILRHPDMPVEAFADLWSTLKAGRPWTGYVKNRCKNGDYYWVLANVTPIWEGGNITGYLSVRRTATREAIATHEEVYRSFREGRQGRTVIRHGIATKVGLGTRFANVGMGWKLLAVMGCGTLLLSLALFLALASNFRMEDQFKGFVDHDLNEAQAYQQMYAQGLQMGQALRNYYLDPANGKSLENLKKARSDFDEALNQAGKFADDSTTKTAVAKITELKDKQKAKADQAIELIAAGKLDEARTLINEQDTPNWRNLKQVLQDEIVNQQSNAGKLRGVMEKSASDQRSNTLIIAAIAIIGSGLLTLLLLRSAQRRLKVIYETLNDVSQGNYSNQIDVTRDDEMGFVLQRMQAMQTRLGFEMAETKRMADENLRVKIALDNVSTGVMIADPQRYIIYTNKSVERILKGAEADIRKVLPNFDASRLVGMNIDGFHKNPAHQAQMLASLSSNHTAKLQLGSRHMTVSANPVISDKGERLGSVAEWSDRTAEVLVEQEVQEIIEGAARGEFSNRLATDNKEGFFHALALGINQLMETTSNGLHDVANVLQNLSEGDLTKSIDADYQGLFGQLKDATNTTIGRLQEVMTRIKHASDAIHTAAQEIAAGNADLSRRTEEQASSLEETASSMEELNATVRQNADNSRQANDLARSSNDVANRGGAMVKQVVTTMDEIQQSSKKIADIIGVIDSIAFQTNILALNAAVEAARAGEQGRGFAVVAAEVRNLAQRSATAAKEIKSLIIESVDKVEDGAKLVRTAGSTMEDVVVSFQKVASLVTEISNASREQSGGIEQVTQAVSQMDEVTQQNAALVEQAAAAAESLEDQSNGLVQALSMFKLATGPADNAGFRTTSAGSAGTSRKGNLPSTRVLRDATPRQLPPAARPSTAHASVAEDEWEEF